MPKAFSKQEKETIRSQLHAEGQRLFAIHGLKKTSVEDLTKAVGISKGAFYLFYPSKEELMMAILEQLEAEIQTRILNYATGTQVDARQHVQEILTHFLLLWDDYPLLKHFSQEDYLYLVRKLSAERVQAHIDQDEIFIANFTAKLTQDGIAMNAPPRVVSNLIKSLFFIGLHRDDLGNDAYQETMAILINLVAGYMTEGV